MTQNAKSLPGRPQAGFTLLELMVGIILTSILIVILVNTLFSVNKSWDNSKDTVISNQNTRAALEFMIKDIRMAGTGFSGTKVVTGGVPGDVVYPLHPSPGIGGAADTLHVIGGFEGVQSITSLVMSSPSDAIHVMDSTPFALGDLVVVTDGIRSNLFEITTAPATSNVLQHSPISPHNSYAGHSEWPTGGYGIGTRVVKVDRVSYWIDTSGTVSQLLRSLNGGTATAVAFDTENMQIIYRLLDGSESQSPSDPSEIVSVVLQYTSAPAGGTGIDTMLVQIQPRVMG